MRDESTEMGRAPCPFTQQLRADVLAEDALLYKQVIVLATIGLLLLLRQLALS